MFFHLVIYYYCSGLIYNSSNHQFSLVVISIFSFVIPAEAGIQVLLACALTSCQSFGGSHRFCWSLLIRLRGKKTAGVVDDAVDSRNRGERNFVQRLNLDWPVAVHKPKTGKNVVNVVDPVRGNHNAIGLGLNATRGIADEEPNRCRAIGQIDDSER